MMLLVQLLEPFAGDMGINLGGRNVGMAQQELHYAQIRAVVEQVRGEGMAQHMR